MATKSRFDVESGRATITVDHLDEKLTFAYPAKGPNHYNEVRKQIDKDDFPSQLYRPTTSQTISLIYAALQNKDNKYAQEILYVLKNKCFWCFTKNLWTSKGVYVVNDTGDIPINKKDLEKMLDNPNVRFVPNGFKLGKQSFKEFEENPYIVAHAEGQENAQKLAEIAADVFFGQKPSVHGLRRVAKDDIRVTNLDSNWVGYTVGFFGDRLCCDISYGYAFGVQK